MASIERTAYPRFRRVVTALELAALSPTDDEVRWAKARARSDEHLLALVVALACFQRLGYFPRADEIPAAVVEHVRRCLELPEATTSYGPPSPAGSTSAPAGQALRSRPRCFSTSAGSA